MFSQTEATAQKQVPDVGLDCRFAADSIPVGEPIEDCLKLIFTN